MGCGVLGAGCGVRGAPCGVRGAPCGVRGAGCAVRGAEMICRTCGAEIADKAIVCYRCGAPTAAPAPVRRPPPARRPAWLVVLLAVLLAAAGVWTGLSAATDSAAQWAGWVLAAVAVAVGALALVRRR